MTRLDTPSPRPIPERFIRRCEETGLSVWRVGLDGELRRTLSNSRGLEPLASAEPIRRALREAAPRWAEENTPRAVQGVRGLWLLPFRLMERRRCAGLLVGVGFGDDFEAHGLTGLGLSPGAPEHDGLQRAFAGAPRLGPGSVDSVHRLLRGTLEDLTHVETRDDTVSGFTDQLTDAYETIHSLYSIGRLLGDVSHPERVLTDITTRLYETTAFRWVLTRVASDLRLPEGLQGQLISVNDDEIVLGHYRDHVALFEEACIDAADGKCMILDESHGIPRAIGPQVVVQPIRRDGEILGLLAAGLKAGRDNQISSYETLLFEAVGGYVFSFLNNVLLFHDQRVTFLGTLRALTAAIDAKDRYTRGHSERVAMLSSALARGVGLRPAECDRIHIAGLVHDVGKIGVAEKVLTKPGRLTDEEFDKIRAHPEIGYRILRDIPALRDVLPGVLHHHERWDGRGYPHNLSGEQIPLMARIIALADTFDAMSSTRSYRPAMPRDLVLQEIERCAGQQFDAQLARAFVRLDFTAYDERVREHQRQEHDLGDLPSAA
ncbi:MAG: HD-GYP domain-containing protein [Phycisphaerales bacterium JB040]